MPLKISSNVLEVVALEKNDDDPILSVMVIAQSKTDPVYSAIFPVAKNLAPEIGDLVTLSIDKE